MKTIHSPTIVKPKHLTLKQRLAESFGITCLGAAFFTLLALLSYHPLSASPQSHYNIAGQAGQNLAQLLLLSFGNLAYLFPLSLIYASTLSFRNEVTNWKPNYLFLCFQVLGSGIIIVTGCGLTASLIKNQLDIGNYPRGGLIGIGLSDSLASLFNPIGAQLIMTALLLSGVTLATGISWLGIIDQLGAISLKMIKFLWNSLKKLQNLWGHLPSHRNKLIHTKLNIPQKLPTESLAKPKHTSTVFIDTTPLQPTDSVSPTSKTHASPVLPLSIDLLDATPETFISEAYTPTELETLSREVELRLKDFGIDVQVVTVHPGPVVTRFEMQLAPGIKASRITTLAKDLARSLSVVSVRIVEIIPGKSVVGLELPNRDRHVVRLREVLNSSQYKQARSSLSLALGKDIAGHPVVVDLAKMPHLLVAGTTGSGKSVGLNAMLLSMLYKATPEQVRLIMIDPKMLELAIYEGIPHLLAPVVTDMKEAANALRWCVAEMDRRYKLMASLGVRNLLSYNEQVKTAMSKGKPLQNPFTKGEKPEVLQPLPYILVLVDEFADMMMVVGKKVEELIARIAQKARAAGIHLVLATQRPSVDVITGLIKANIPTRIAFQVSSRIDSRTILDQQGAEQLLGYGDMLYSAPGTGVPVRVHGAFVADDEVHRIVSALKQMGTPDYQLAITAENNDREDKAKDSQEEQDPLYDQAVQIVLETRRASTSSIQRRLKIGYNRAARIMEDMEKAGLVSTMESSGNREVLVPDQPPYNQ